MTESIILETQTDGCHPNGETYHNKSENTIIEGKKLRQQQVIAALKKAMKSYLPIYRRIRTEDLTNWLKESRVSPDPQPLNIGDKDFPTRTTSWRIKYQRQQKTEC